MTSDLIAANALASALILMAVHGDVMAETPANFPQRPVRIVVPLAPGGGSDIVGRIVALALTDRWKHAVVVDNRPGAGGTLGNAIVGKATADGYTLLVSSSTVAIAPALYKNPDAAVAQRLTAVSLLADQPSILAVNTQLPVKSVQDLIALMKSNPGKYAFGSAGTGTASHLANELFTASAGVKGLHVPYKSAGLAATALLAGEVQFMVTNMATALPQMRAGRLHGLGVTSTRRVKAAPELPTLAEAGVAGFDYTTWYGLLGPPALPPAIAQRLHSDLAALGRDAGVTERFSGQGLEVRFSTPPAFERFFKAELVRWQNVVNVAGLQAN